MRELFTDRLAVVADEAHPLQRRRNLTLADLVGQQWMLPSAHVLIRQQLEAAFAELGLPPPILRVETDFGSATLFDLVRGTDILCMAAANGNSRIAGLHPIALRADALDLGRRVGVLSRAGAYLSPLAKPDGGSARREVGVSEFAGQWQPLPPLCFGIGVDGSSNNDADTD